jgi:hypothetical protein
VLGKLGMVVHGSNLSYLGDGGKKLVSSRQVLEKLGRLYTQNKIQKQKDWGVWLKW